MSVAFSAQRALVSNLTLKRRAPPNALWSCSERSSWRGGCRSTLRWSSRMLARSSSIFCLLVAGCAVSVQAPSSDRDDYSVLNAACNSQPSAETCGALSAYLSKETAHGTVPCVAPARVTCQAAGETQAVVMSRVIDLEIEADKKACSFKDGKLCFEAAILDVTIKEGTSDAEWQSRSTEAEALFAQACTLGAQGGCGFVGSTKPNGVWGRLHAAHVRNAANAGADPQHVVQSERP